MPKMKTKAYKGNNSFVDRVNSYEWVNAYPLVRGSVEDNDDPKKVGRVKVRIVALHGTESNGMPLDQLPWAAPCIWQASYNSGSFVIPEVHNVVWIMFEDGDLNKPVYIGGVYGTGVHKEKWVANTGGEKRYQITGKNEKPDDVKTLDDKVVYKSPKRALFWMHEKRNEERITMEDQIGQVMEMEAPFGGKSIAMMDSIPKEDMLDGIAKMRWRSVNKSLVELENTKEYAKYTIDLKGPFPLKVEMDTRTGVITIIRETDQKKIEINEDNVRIETESSDVIVHDDHVEVDASEVIDLTAPLIRLNAVHVFLGEG